MWVQMFFTSKKGKNTILSWYLENKTVHLFENVTEHSSWFHPGECNCYLMQFFSIISQPPVLFMQECSMLINDALIMIGGAAGNAATITISHLLYRYFK